MRTAPVLLAAAGLMGAACSDPASPPIETAGVAFTDELGRAFNTAGQPSFTIEGDVNPVDFAVAFPDSVGGLVIAGFEQVDGTRGDLFILQFTENRTGAFDPCATNSDCHGRLLLGIDAANVSDVEEFWELSGGSATITQNGGGRVTGTFSDFVYTGPNGGEAALRVADGSFDVPLLSEATGREVMRCFLTRATGGTCP